MAHERDCQERKGEMLADHRGKKGTWGSAACVGAKFFVGYRRSGALVAPQLERHVANKLQEEVSVVKKRRKHAEEPGLARAPPAKGGKTG